MIWLLSCAAADTAMEQELLGWLDESKRPDGLNGYEGL